MIIAPSGLLGLATVARLPRGLSTTRQRYRSASSHMWFSFVSKERARRRAGPYTGTVHMSPPQGLPSALSQGSQAWCIIGIYQCVILAEQPVVTRDSLG